MAKEKLEVSQRLLLLYLRHAPDSGMEMKSVSGSMRQASSCMAIAMGGMVSKEKPGGAASIPPGRSGVSWSGQIAYWTQQKPASCRMQME